MTNARSRLTLALALGFLPAVAWPQVPPTPPAATAPVAVAAPPPAPGQPLPPPPIEVHWAFIQQLLADPSVPYERRIAVLQSFILLFPGDHPRRNEAGALIARLEREHAAATRAAFTTGTEWFAFQLGGGPYVAALMLDFVTLRWPYLFWEVVHFRVNGFISVGAIEAGSVVGFPLRLDALGRHELRFGVALVFAAIIRNHEGTYSGLGLTPQVSYLYRRSKHFAVEATASVLVPVAGTYSDVDDPPKRPPPCPIGAVGLRF